MLGAAEPTRPEVLVMRAASRPSRLSFALVSAATRLPNAVAAQADPRLERLETEALTMVEARAEMVQEIADMLFSFGELGMQEFETGRHPTGTLRDNGFEIEPGVAGMP